MHIYKLLIHIVNMVYNKEEDVVVLRRSLEKGCHQGVYVGHASWDPFCYGNTRLLCSSGVACSLGSVHT